MPRNNEVYGSFYVEHYLKGTSTANSSFLADEQKVCQETDIRIRLLFPLLHALKRTPAQCRF